MTFKKALKTCLFDKYCTFKGRATRPEFWWFALFQLLLSVPLYVIASRIEKVPDTENLPIMLLLFVIIFAIPLLVTLIPSIAVTVRRLHDSGKSGWWYFIGLFPVLDVVFLVFMLWPSDEHENKYGPYSVGNDIEF